MSSDASNHASGTPDSTASPLAIAQFRPGGRSVLLLHTLSDGSEHVDWLSESATAPAGDGLDARTLIAYRLPVALDQLPVGATIAAERIADHRQLYLDFEGQISGGRGQVRRLAHGRIIEVCGTGKAMVHLMIAWQAGEHSGRVLQRLGVEVGGEGSAASVRCESRVNAAQ